MQQFKKISANERIVGHLDTSGKVVFLCFWNKSCTLNTQKSCICLEENLIWKIKLFLKNPCHDLFHLAATLGFQVICLIPVFILKFLFLLLDFETSPSLLFVNILISLTEDTQRINKTERDVNSRAWQVGMKLDDPQMEVLIATGKHWGWLGLINITFFSLLY